MASQAVLDIGREADNHLYPRPTGGYHLQHPSTAQPRAMVNESGSTPDRRPAGPLTSDATVDLLELVRQGDQAALSRLLERCMPPLRRWAHGRLPHDARSMQDTADLVQDAVFVAMRHLDVFESRHQGALQAYLRQSVMNRIRDLIRQRRRRPVQTELPEQIPDDALSPLDQAIGSQNLARYERAVQCLAAADREAIIGRVEMQYSYDELAVALNKPTAAAARMAVTRAMKRLAQEMARV